MKFQNWQKVMVWVVVLVMVVGWGETAVWATSHNVDIVNLTMPDNETANVYGIASFPSTEPPVLTFEYTDGVSSHTFLEASNIEWSISPFGNEWVAVLPIVNANEGIIKVTATFQDGKVVIAIYGENEPTCNEGLCEDRE